MATTTPLSPKTTPKFRDVRNVAEYGSLGIGELRAELIQITGAIASKYESLGAALADQQQDYITAYVQSPGNSVAAKNREAEWNTQVQIRDIIESRATINSLTLCRDLLVFLLWGTRPDSLPFPQIVGMDEAGMASP
jgi:hypothetical protein